MTGLLVTILQGTNLLGVLTNVGLELALKIKALFSSLGNDITVNIHQVSATTVEANNDTITAVNEWLVANGRDPLPLQPSPVPKVTAGPVVDPPVLQDPGPAK